MAQTAHLFLKANGEDIAGDSTITSLEREDSIECVSRKRQITAQGRR